MISELCSSLYYLTLKPLYLWSSLLTGTESVFLSLAKLNLVAGLPLPIKLALSAIGRLGAKILPPIGLGPSVKMLRKANTLS